MNKRAIKHIMLFTVAVISVIFSASIAFASEDQDVVSVNVQDFGAIPVEQYEELESQGVAFDTDARIGINKALSQALTLNDGQTLEVVIPPGEYWVQGNLRMFSNTRIVAHGATIVGGGFDGSLLRGAHTHDGQTICDVESGPGKQPGKYECSKGEYTQIQNVTVDGGTWDAGSNSNVDSQCIQFRHGENITLRNLIVQNSTNHMINLAATKNVLVENIVCRNAKKYTGGKSYFYEGDISGLPQKERFRSIEAIHLDFASDSGERFMSPRDDTPVINATIKDCTFNNVFAGVGTHHINSRKASGITVDNCTFRCLRSNGESSTELEYGNAVYFKSADGVNVTNNKVAYARSLVDFVDVSNIDVSGNQKGKESDADMRLKMNGIYLNNCNGSIRNNVGIATTNSEKNGVYIENSNVTLEGNTILGGKKGIALMSGTCTLSGNRINSCKEHGIYAAGGSKVTAISNTITSPTKFGVCVMGTGTTMNASKNAISNSGKNGIYADAKAKLNASSNTVTSPGQCGILAVDATAKVEGNTVKNSVHNGVFVDKCLSGSTVTGNTVTDAKQAGIQIRSTPSCPLKNNIVTNAVGHGIFVSGESASKTCTAFVENNKSISNKNVGSKWDIIIYTNAKNCTVKNNTYGYRDVSVASGSATTVSGNKCGVTKKSLANAKVTNVVAKTYTGKTCEQNPVVKIDGKTLKKGTDYKLNYTYSISVGKATVKISGKGWYGGSISKTYRINPKGTSLSKLTAGKKKISVTWKKQSAKMRNSVINGYQIQYSTKKSFSGAKSITVKGFGKTSLTIKKLVSGKTYYVKVRTYKKSNNVTYYSPWSGYKAVRVK